MELLVVVRFCNLYEPLCLQRKCRLFHQLGFPVVDVSRFGSSLCSPKKVPPISATLVPRRRSPRLPIRRLELERLKEE